MVSGDATYALYLDDALLADNVPLQRNYGYLGLITAQSAVAYNAVTVSGGQAAAPGWPAAVTTGTFSSAQGFSDQKVVSGNWEINKGIYRDGARLG